MGPAMDWIKNYHQEKESYDLKRKCNYAICVFAVGLVLSTPFILNGCDNKVRNSPVSQLEKIGN